MKRNPLHTERKYHKSISQSIQLVCEQLETRCLLSSPATASAAAIQPIANPGGAADLKFTMNPTPTLPAGTTLVAGTKPQAYASSLADDPSKPGHMFAVFSVGGYYPNKNKKQTLEWQDTGANGFYSTNSGKNWLPTTTKLNNMSGWTLTDDPSAVFDSKGNLFLCSMGYNGSAQARISQMAVDYTYNELSFDRTNTAFFRH